MSQNAPPVPTSGTLHGLDFRCLGQGKGVVDVHAQIANRVLDLAVVYDDIMATKMQISGKRKPTLYRADDRVALNCSDKPSQLCLAITAIVLVLGHLSDTRIKAIGRICAFKERSLLWLCRIDMTHIVFGGIFSPTLAQQCQRV